MSESGPTFVLGASTIRRQRPRSPTIRRDRLGAKIDAAGDPRARFDAAGGKVTSRGRESGFTFNECAPRSIERWQPSAQRQQIYIEV